MSNDKSREQFEARFPVPAGVAWSEEHQNYGWVKKSAFQKTITYRALFTGWQESRAALVIELPPIRPEPVSSGDSLKADGDAATWNIWVGEKLAKLDCRAAIEALGLKVKS